MKTTLEIQDDLFRLAKMTAVQQGRSLKELVNEALREKLTRDGAELGNQDPPWMQYFGAFGGSAENRKENQRIQAAIDAEFGTIDPLEERRS